MSEKKPSNLFNFSVVHAGIAFLVLGVLYFVCIIAVAAHDEGTGEYYPVLEIILRIITVPAYVVHYIMGDFLPFLLMHVIALVLDALLIAVVIQLVKVLLRKNK